MCIRDRSGGINTIFTTPVVRGQITDVYVYEEGSDYGSNILNFHRNPKVVAKIGQDAQLKPIVKRGYIVAVEVQNRGKFYDAAPDLEINGDGVGAKLRAVVRDGKILNVIIINILFPKNNAVEFIFSFLSSSKSIIA